MDGSRLDIIRKWIGEGHLPDLGKLIEKGSYGNLISVLPGPHTSPAWASFATGKNPGKHGVYYMLMRKDGYELKVASSIDVKSKTLWDYFSDNKKFSCVMNVPMTYPPRPFNGIMVTSWGTPALENDYTYPPDVKNELKKFNFYIQPEYKRTEECRKSLMNLLRSKIKAAEFIMNKYSWDLFINV